MNISLIIKKWKRPLLIVLMISLIQITVFLVFYLQQNKQLPEKLLQIARSLATAFQQAEQTVTQPKVMSKKFTVYQGEHAVGDFDDLKEAILHAKQASHTMSIRLTKEDRTLWSNEDQKKEARKLTIVDAPYYSQLPELPRGCEVTTLAMLLGVNGFSVDKMVLAREIVRDPTPLSYDSEQNMRWGNPYKGFVGDMYDAKKPGFGVFHKPIEELARKYAGQQVMNLTDLDFSDITSIVGQGIPVWVIVTSTFAQDNSRSVKWLTADGPIQTTRNEHSVLLTGFDGTYVYFHDPLRQAGKGSRRAVSTFEQGWNQMGKQAITIILQNEKIVDN
ncbi:C39 family peptidase [Brevibacillus reuszeri]|nr:C39 family peptidase [Brevibacillus reuszeri]MED1858611.1 C39 family peptidase [Brevibacillus reuszeri]